MFIIGNVLRHYKNGKKFPPHPFIETNRFNSLQTYSQGNISTITSPQFRGLDGTVCHTQTVLPLCGN